MKEDYLWDKTGEDSEIEMLENALQAFRYQETATPELAAKILPFKKQAPRKFFRLAMTAAACLMFGLFVLAAWFQASNKETETKSDLAEMHTAHREAPFVFRQQDKETGVLATKTPENQPLKRLEKSKQASEQKFVKIRNIVRANVRQRETPFRNIRKVKPDVLLTKEERHAYGQLMLALSITSSKLKIVKDKAQRLEGQTAVAEHGK